MFSGVTNHASLSGSPLEEFEGFQESGTSLTECKGWWRGGYGVRVFFSTRFLGSTERNS